MTEPTIALQDNKKNLFWSPLAVFLLGTPAAALNWWQMGNKRKAIVFVCVTICMMFFLKWIKPSQLDWQYYGKGVVYSLYFARVLIGLVFSFVVMKINWRDVEEFIGAGKPVTRVGSSLVLAIWLGLALIWIPINLGAEYMGRFTSYCHFPRLLDIVYRYQVSQRTDLDSILMRRSDFSCDLIWMHETYEDSSSLSENEMIQSYRLSGVYGENDSFRVYQDVFFYEQPVGQKEFDEAISWNANAEDADLGIVLPTNQPKPDFMKIYCSHNSVTKECSVYIAHGRTLVHLRFLGDNAPGFDEYIVSPVLLISQRILQFED